MRVKREASISTFAFCPLPFAFLLMSSIYLMRHGQAGLRANYDALSELGRRQASLLGRYLASQGVAFRAAFAGALVRQQATAAEVCCAYGEAGLAFPEIETDHCWNEFDLDGVYADLAPQLAAASEEFRREHEDMLRRIAGSEAAVHREWTRCDTLVMRAWIEGRLPCRAESYTAFQERVLRAAERLQSFSSGEAVAVFTSATPIAIWISHALGVAGNGRLMRLAGVMYNSALTTVRLQGGEATLFTFNGTPHLERAELRTFR